jgi:hypothetical protein
MKFNYDNFSFKNSIIDYITLLKHFSKTSGKAVNVLENTIRKTGYPYSAWRQNDFT